MRIGLALLLPILAAGCQSPPASKLPTKPAGGEPWVADLGDGRYRTRSGSATPST
jgi:hypothetical protein